MENNFNTDFSLSSRSIDTIQDTLDAVMEYLDKYADTIDTEFGPEPNEAMKLFYDCSLASLMLNRAYKQIA
jgi:hypothetical protein